MAIGTGGFVHPTTSWKLLRQLRTSRMHPEALKVPHDPLFRRFSWNSQRRRHRSDKIQRFWELWNLTVEESLKIPLHLSKIKYQFLFFFSNLWKLAIFMWINLPKNAWCDHLNMAYYGKEGSKRKRMVHFKDNSMKSAQEANAALKMRKSKISIDSKGARKDNSLCGCHSYPNKDQILECTTKWSSRRSLPLQ